MRPVLLPLVLSLGVILALVASWPHKRPVLSGTPVVELSRTNLTRLNDQWYELGRTNPFTGIMLEFYPGGVPMSRSAISNGLLNGLSQGWFTNGQIQISETYRDNFSDGLRTKWYPNGQKLSEAPIVHGKIEGLFRRWHQNGALAEEIPMHDGQPNGVGRSWYLSGFLQAEVELRGGKLINEKKWADGEHKASSPNQS